MDRRTFLKVSGIGGLSIAAGCTSRPEKNLFSHVHAPMDEVTGKANWYASTCRECPAGCGILAKNKDGRVIKIEGNPSHPINKGKVCIRGQAALQGLYNPDRIKRPLLKEKDGWRPLAFGQAEALLIEKAREAAGKGENRVFMLTEVVGASLMGLFTQSLSRWRSEGPVVFEPFAYESLKTANHEVLGVEGLPAYRLDQADLLISFGADFLETWLSPVEYARKFKEMHAVKKGRKGLFIHVSPYQSLTCANADRWFPCNPAAEAAIALGLIREILGQGRGRGLPEDLRAWLVKMSKPFSSEKVSQLSGLGAGDYRKLLNRLTQAEKPLALGVGSAASGRNPLQADIAINLLNLVLDPALTLFDFDYRHRIEGANRRSEVMAFFARVDKGPGDLLLLNNVNPVFAIPPGSGVKGILEKPSLFVVSFSNFMDETTALADLILPVQLPLETWDEYGGVAGLVSMLQPTMGGVTGAPGLGDLFLRISSDDGRPEKDFRAYLYSCLVEEGRVRNESDWLKTLQEGGVFEPLVRTTSSSSGILPDRLPQSLEEVNPLPSGLAFMAVPSIRFYDGRGANRPWLCEVPDPLTKIAWQTPVLVHPDSLAQNGLKQGDVIRIKSEAGSLEAPVYESVGTRRGVLVVPMGQGHESFGRYAQGMGVNPLMILSCELEPASGAPLYNATPVTIHRTGRSMKLAHTDGSRMQHGRKIALSADLKSSSAEKSEKGEGLAMWDFPLALPLPGGYNPKRDFYTSHQHGAYRWAMVVDLDKCIGCGACAAACYAENNLGVVGLDRMLEGREMSWLMVQRYQEPQDGAKIIFLPMLCQHCDNAPCESVCPVFAPHHSKEGLNNQIYNRCIGTRFCSQNCPYKVRRFNWFTWNWPEPLHLQLNPDVTVRSKGVMEKCSFCIQRIKESHNVAKNEKRTIRDGEIQPACLQTCPTGVFTFGNLMDKESRVRRLVEDKRAYQIMGYLNTKPAVIYLKKVVQEV